MSSIIMDHPQNAEFSEPKKHVVSPKTNASEDFSSEDHEALASTSSVSNSDSEPHEDENSDPYRNDDIGNNPIANSPNTKTLNSNSGNNFNQSNPVTTTVKHREFKCQVCDQQFNSSTSLQRHRVIFKHHDINSKIPLKCSKCNLLFLHVGLLENHIRTVHDEEVEQDLLNQPKFNPETNMQETLQGILKMAMNQKMIQGDSGFTMNSEIERLLNKMAVHQNIPQVMELIQVKINNDDQTSFKCELCSQRFANKPEFEFHLAQHFTYMSGENLSRGVMPVPNFLPPLPPSMAQGLIPPLELLVNFSANPTVNGPPFLPPGFSPNSILAAALAANTSTTNSLPEILRSLESNELHQNQTTTTQAQANGKTTYSPTGTSSTKSCCTSPLSATGVTNSQNNTSLSSSFGSQPYDLSVNTTIDETLNRSHQTTSEQAVSPDKKTNLLMPVTLDGKRCSICNKAFTCASALRIHFRKHSGERPYKCKFCSKAFSQNGTLKRHYQTCKLAPGNRSTRNIKTTNHGSTKFRRPHNSGEFDADGKSQIIPRLANPPTPLSNFADKPLPDMVKPPSELLNVFNLAKNGGPPVPSIINPSQCIGSKMASTPSTSSGVDFNLLSRATELLQSGALSNALSAAFSAQNRSGEQINPLHAIQNHLGLTIPSISPDNLHQTIPTPIINEHKRRLSTMAENMLQAKHARLGLKAESELPINDQEEENRMNKSVVTILKDLVNKQMLFACDKCQIWFEKEDMFQSHKSQHIQSLDYSCSYCHQIMENAVEFQQHFLLNAENEFVCRESLSKIHETDESEDSDESLSIEHPEDSRNSNFLN